MPFRINYLFLPDQCPDEQLKMRLESGYCFGCIEATEYKEIYVFVNNVASTFREPEAIIEKLNYTVCHEVIHGLLKTRNESLVHSYTLALMKPFMKKILKIHKRNYPRYYQKKVPVIFLDSEETESKRESLLGFIRRIRSF